MSELPIGWEWTQLEELAAPIDRAITDGPFGSNLKSEHYTETGARVIRLQNIGDGFFRDERSYISLRHFDNLRSHEVRTGDLVVASLGDNPPRACLIPELNASAIVKADCIRIRLADNIDPRWVLYSLVGPEGKRHAANLIRGIGRPRLGMSQVWQIPIPVPPLAEQRRIVAALEDHLSRLDAGNLAICDATRRASLIRIKLLKDLLMPTNNDWEVRAIDELAQSVRNGIFVSRASVDPVGVPILRIGSVRMLSLDLSDLRYSRKSVEEIRRSESLLNEGDLLFTRYNGNPDYVGACAVIPKLDYDLTYPDKLIRVIPNKVLVEPEFLAISCSTGSARHQIQQLVKTTAGQAGISGRDLKTVRVQLPMLEEQRRIAAMYAERRSQLDPTTSLLTGIEHDAEHLRRSLLAEAFAGRLVPQDPNDEPASVLLERIRAERAVQQKPKRTRRATEPTQEPLL